MGARLRVRVRVRVLSTLTLTLTLTSEYTGQPLLVAESLDLSATQGVGLVRG